ncbi:MAG: hypothetical protein PHZ19_07755 [Candidatus Thermoplasmatota archaeon]|nr:hypothetical protein [Candidatus Thermoplasmatota archaeon]
MSKKAALVIVGLAIIGGIAYAVTREKKEFNPSPPDGEISFTVVVLNVPLDATGGWACAFHDKSSNIYYQPENAPVGIGLHTFSNNQEAVMRVPTDSGELSIIAGSSSGEYPPSIVIAASYLMPLNVVKGGRYVFDFASGKIS